MDISPTEGSKNVGSIKIERWQNVFGIVAECDRNVHYPKVTLLIIPLNQYFVNSQSIS